MSAPLAVVGMSLAILGGPLASGSPTMAAQRPQTLNSPTPPPPNDGPLDVSDARALVNRWGVAVDSLRLSASGYMLDFRFRVIDARKAKPLFVRRTKPVMRDEATGAELAVPVPPKTGALRSSNDPKAGRTYFMFFGNPGRQIAEGASLSLTIGPFAVRGLRVQGEAGAAAAPPAVRQTSPRGARVMTRQPAIDRIELTNHQGLATTLGEAIGDGPALVNFIFTSCTTICPVMTTGFSQVQSMLDQGPKGTRLVSVSIDPGTDTAAVLERYAKKYHAGAGWHFLTGTPKAVEAAQRAFDAYRGDPYSHEPLTYVRRSKGAPWEVLEGLPSRKTLLRALGRSPQSGF